MTQLLMALRPESRVALLDTLKALEERALAETWSGPRPLSPEACAARSLVRREARKLAKLARKSRVAR